MKEVEIRYASPTLSGRIVREPHRPECDMKLDYMYGNSKIRIGFLCAEVELQNIKNSAKVLKFAILNI